jgi:hypothetical protein
MRRNLAPECTPWFMRARLSWSVLSTSEATAACSGERTQTSLSHSWSTPSRRNTFDATPLAQPGTSILDNRSFRPSLSLDPIALAVSLTGVVATSSRALVPAAADSGLALNVPLWPIRRL